MERTFCYFCHQPIKLEELGGMFKAEDKEQCFHNNVVCLVMLRDWQKENGVTTDADVVNFGKYKGQLWSEVPSFYMRLLLDKAPRAPFAARMRQELEGRGQMFRPISQPQKAMQTSIDPSIPEREV
jgi:hypothetical protein